MRHHCRPLFLERVDSGAISPRRADSIGRLPLRSPRSSYQDVQGHLVSPVSPVSPATLNSARVWAHSPELTPRVVEISRSGGPVTTWHSRGERQRPLLLRRQTTSHHKVAWVHTPDQSGPRVSFTIKSPSMQSIASGASLIGLAISFVVLSLKNDLAMPIRIALILLIIMSSIVFIHSLLRMAMNYRKRHHVGSGKVLGQNHCHGHGLRVHYPEPASPFDVLPCDDSTYTPRTPVRVHLLYDEEASLGKEELEEHAGTGPLLTPPPPAYGLWRCSVRADPALLHWERIGTFERNSAPMTERPTINRPPSYPGHDGLDDLSLGSPGPAIEIVDVDEWDTRRQSLAVDEVSRMMRAGEERI